MQSSRLPRWQGLIEEFARRDHIELHLTDRCNLKCTGCTYLQDQVPRPLAVSLPASAMRHVLSIFKARAVTLVGGGEPTLYESDGMRIGDFICQVGRGEFGIPPALGLITNGTVWPLGERCWHEYVKWIRISVDAADRNTYSRCKGVDHLELVIDNVFR